MDAEHVLALLAHLEAAGVSTWVDGGWGVDALLGEQTRRHDDLDLVVRLEDAAALERALGERGYAVGFGAPPLGFELVDAGGRQVDVHPFATSPSGDGHYRRADGGTYVYPAAAFAGAGRIMGLEVRCLTPEAVLAHHAAGYTLDAAHRRDVRALAERYGLPIPRAAAAPRTGGRRRRRSR